MFDESRIAIYNYIYGLLYGVVSENVYSMYDPTELTESDTKDGFIVIQVGNMVNESEFQNNAYALTRVYVYAYVPPKSRGRLNKTLYQTFETSINNAINNEIRGGTNLKYSILEDSSLSWDDYIGSNDDNRYFVYIKSFIVQIDNL